MKYVGVDLHKHVIVLCVVTRRGRRTKVVCRRRLTCRDTDAIRQFFVHLGRFEVVVEATAAYEWFFVLTEDLADRLVLAHPKKLRVIAESTRKRDTIDAEVLAVFLALDMIPEAYRPCPRVRRYRVLVRHRCGLQRRVASVAVDADPGRLAAGSHVAAVAWAVGTAAEQYGFQEEGHCGNRAAIAGRDVCRAAGGPAVSPGRLKDSHNVLPEEYSASSLFRILSNRSLNQETGSRVGRACGPWQRPRRRACGRARVRPAFG